MKRMFLAVATAIVLAIGVGSVAQAAPHGGHRSSGGGQRSNIGIHTPMFSFEYGNGGHAGRGYSGHGGHGYGGYGGGRYQSGHGHSAHHRPHSW